MTSELNFRLAEVAQEQSLLLLSKVSGVPIETIERLQASIQVKEITEENLQQLILISAALEIQIIDLIPLETHVEAPRRPTARAIFIDKIVKMVRQRGVEIESTKVSFPRSGGVGEMMNGLDEARLKPIILFDIRPECIPYAACVAAGFLNCSNPHNC
jgi:hypothetical protein